MKKDLTNIEGTVANIMQKRIDEIPFSGSLVAAKTAVINVLESPEIKQKELAAKYISEINNMKSMKHLLSTITTYLTGQKVVKSHK